MVAVFTIMVPLSACTTAADGGRETAASGIDLSFAFTGAFADRQINAFESALRTRSGGTVDVSIDAEFDQQAPGFEQRVIKAVASRDLDLGWVGVRAFSELGVHHLEPLLAPFLVDSLETERKVLASGLPEKLLDSLDAAGVRGLALMAGPVRHPIATGAPLRSLEDYARVPFFATPTRMTLATVAALGAEVIDVSPDERNAGIESGTIRAYDNSIVFMAHVPDWPVNQVTANVGLYPSMGVLIVNPDVLDALPTSQQKALVAAAKDASAQSPELSVDQVGDVTALCRSGARFGLATPEDVTELRAAVEPIYARLRAQADAAELLAELVDLKGSTPPDVVPFPAGCAAP